jgi:hypothetical protein
MKVEMDSDVKSVLEFMQGRFDHEKLVQIAAGVALVAPIIWTTSNFRPLSLTHEQASADPV